MTKGEFLEGLRHALANDLSGSVIQENVNYYDSYINDEVRKGRNEADVIAELGDPWVIAQTIIESVEISENTQRNYTYESRQQGYGQQTYEHSQAQKSGGLNILELNTWWKKLLLILVIVGVIVIIFSIIAGLFNLLAPIIVPVLVIILVLRLIDRKR